jgi:hypothetical protein
MGCDIHIYVEKKIGDTWYPLTPPQHNPYYEPGDEEEGGPWSQPLTLEHRVFSMLAGVRNGHGFAGIKTGEPITPISEPRGLPDDVCAEIKEISDAWDIDGHSHSHFTLAELDAVPWKQNEIHSCGWVDAAQFQVWEKEGQPQQWCGDMTGDSVVKIPNDEMRAMLALEGADLELPDNPYFGFAKLNGTTFLTQVEWSNSWAEIAGELLASMEKLRAAGAAEGFEPDQLRYTFWFDN